MNIAKLNKAIEAIEEEGIQFPQETVEAPASAVLELIYQAQLMRDELMSIQNREKYYVKENRWDEMVPWFDLTPNEKANAIEYWK